METTMLRSLFSMVSAIETMAFAIDAKATSDSLHDVCEAILRHCEKARTKLSMIGSAYHAGGVSVIVQGKPVVFEKIIAKKFGDAMLECEVQAYALERQTQNNFERKQFRTLGCNMRNGRQRLDIVSRASKFGSIVELTGDRDATREAIEAKIDHLKPTKVSKKG